MPAGPHVICSTCGTNVDTDSASVAAQGELPDDRKLWIIACSHVLSIFPTPSPPVIGESRGLIHIADDLLAERNKIMREGSELLKRFKELQEQVEAEDDKLATLLEKHGITDFRALMEAGDRIAAMEEDAGNSGDHSH